MKKTKKEFLVSKGWKVYDTAWEAVGMSPEEAELAETKFQMAQKVKELRSTSGITQAQLCRILGFSGLRVAGFLYSLYGLVSWKQCCY
jgi:predicted XRE-type DNA-binding protein